MMTEGFFGVNHVLEAIKQVGANVVVGRLLVEIEEGLENLPLNGGRIRTSVKAESKPRREIKSPTTALHCLRTQHTGSWKHRMYYTERGRKKERCGGVP